MAPRKSAAPPSGSGKPKVAVPPIHFDKQEENARSNRLQKASPKTAKRRTFSDLLTYLFIRFLGVYFVIGALFTCSTQPFSFDYSTKDPNSVCRNLAFAKNHIAPVLSPLVHSAHQRIDPYTGPYVRAVKPYTQTAWKTAKPYYRQASKQGKNVYNKHVEPMRKKAIKRGRAYSDPHVKKFNKQYQKQVQPHVDNLNKAFKPYQDIYDRDVAPYLSQAYSHSLALSGTSYSFYVNRVHPQVVKSLQQLHSFYTYHLDPAVRRAYSLYVRPQVEKLTAKLFERKAHATGSEAISEAKEEVKEAQKEGKARSQQAQEEAVTEANRKKNDPSIVEKAQQATESFLGMADEADEVEMARLDAELEAEGKSVKEQLEAWEEGLSKLMGKEYKLFTERISDLRNRRLADLPDHFDALTESSVEDEVAAVLARLERMYKKLAKSDLSVSDQVKAADEKYETQKAKLVQSQAALQAEIAQYQQMLLNDEAKSLDASVGEIRRYVVEAGRSYSGIMDEAKFEKTVDDFEGWETSMIQRANSIEQDMRSVLEGGKVQSGFDAVDLRKEPKLDSHIADLQSRIKKLYSTAASQVDSYVTKGNMQLRGEVTTLGAISDATDAVATQARQLSEGAAALMLDSVLAARNKIGLGPKENPGILERVQQGLHQATQSVASVVGSTPTASSAGEYVADYASSASSLAASVVGYKTEPESYLDIIGDSASSVLDAASSTAASVGKSAASAYDAAASSAGDAFTAATTSAGNAYNAASSSVADAMPSSIVGEEAVRSIVGVAQEQFGSISHSASSIAQAAASSASSAAGVVSDSASRGVGQGTGSGQGIFESVKAAVESAGEAIERGTEAAREAVVGEDSKVVGKQPEDKDFNTVGKAAEALKDRIVHAEL